MVKPSNASITNATMLGPSRPALKVYSHQIFQRILFNVIIRRLVVAEVHVEERRSKNICSSLVVEHESVVNVGISDASLPKHNGRMGGERVAAWWFCSAGRGREGVRDGEGRKGREGQRVGEIEKAVQVFKGMVFRDVFTWSSMVDGYWKNGMVLEARQAFEAMPVKNVVSWTAMIQVIKLPN
ncbi:hypothetical protein M5K25_000451 [Dendrobium thyrsiflorum]|uniref:Pentatricopeptide repeat-containing protein n=1 Tax=Dendrobium thyrsiflorum TaxID=117978 RepID=A0ABD0W7B7_DENTH